MLEIKELLEIVEAYERELPPKPTLPPAPQGAEIAAWIDHTLLKAEASATQVRDLCIEAIRYSFASVCVNPVYVPLAADLLSDSTVRVCTVVGFPLGATTSGVKLTEALHCLDLGARELDMVIHIGALKSGDYSRVLGEVQAIVEMAHWRGALVKVIIENAVLSRREKIIACLLCKAAGADFVKTSTGFASSGATIEDVDLMRRVVGREVGVKAAGGIRTYTDALALIEAGATRLGTSAGVRIMQEALVEEVR
jgi:deoxyribose-phosphate aldolase